MKLFFTSFILSFALLQLALATHGQQVTLSNRHADLKTLFKEIRQQAGYDFIYTDELLAKAKPVNIQVQAMPVEQVLQLIFQGQPLTYQVDEKTVVVKPRSIFDHRQSKLNEFFNNTVISAYQEFGGKVIDSLGDPVIGATVMVKGTKNGTVTNESGNFVLRNLQKDVVVLVSALGYEQKEVAVTAGNTNVITLAMAANNLNDVVVVGYGTQKKRDLTGSVSQVRGEDINAYPSNNALQALSGRATGVQVLQNNGSPGGNVSVRIRGTNSIQGSNEPLYVIDGFPTTGNPGQLLNNNDIESMQILKDASATAIYGSRGANGVVIITTKKGKSGGTRVDVETSYSTQRVSKEMDLMNAREYATLYNEGAVNDGVPPRFTEEQINSFGEGTDWQDVIFRSAPMSNISANVSGGNDKTQFSLSGSTFKQEGIIIGSDYDRYSARINLNHNISEKLGVSFNTTLTNVKSNQKNSGGGARGASLISGIISSPPVLKPYNEDGTLTVLGTSPYPFIGTVLINPLNFINEQSDILKSNTVLSNVAISYNPIKDLTIRISGGIENNDERSDRYTTTKFLNSQGAATVRSTQFRSLLSENTATYNKLLGSSHQLSALVGFTYQNFLDTYNEGSGSGFINDVNQTYELQAARTPGIPLSAYVKSTLMSYLGRVNYAYDDKYLATVSFRSDGSSKYSEGSKWGFFPSAALAWRISNEGFFSDLRSAIPELKLRLGWGYTGSQAIDAYATLNQLVSSKTVFGDGLYTAYAPGTRLPGDLKWESTETKDIGLDMGILGGRLTVTADYYIKTTRDLLNTVRLPSSMGFISTIRNVGEMENKGFELGVDADILRGNFQWNVNANISFNKNKVLRLYEGQDLLGGEIRVSVLQDNANILREGWPVGQLYGYVEDGYTDAGKIKYLDLNNDNVISDADKTYIGDPNPDFIYGLNSSMSFKNFSFTFFIQGVQGNDIYNVSSINNTMDYGLGLNMPKDVYLNHWTPTNTDAKYPQFAQNSVPLASDRFVEDGSFMRLKNIELAYNVDVAKQGLRWLKKLGVYVSGQNLLTITSYSWWDPEVNSSGGPNSTTQGFDYYSYPNYKSMTFGIRAGF